MNLFVLNSKNINLAVYILSSITLTIFLLYVDEGLNNFSWMTDSLNWISFLIYTVGIVMGQLFFENILLKKFKKKGKIFISLFGGLIIGALFVFLILLFFAFLTHLF